MYCQHCGSEIPEGNAYCFKCGTPVGGKPVEGFQPYQPSTESLEKPPKKKARTVIVAIVAVILILGIGAVAYMATHESPWAETQEPSTTEVEEQTTEESFSFSSWDDFMDSCKDIPYNDLLRNPKQYEGDYIHLEGTVVQASEETENGYEYIVALKDDSWKYIKFVFDAEDDSRLLENDEVDMYGKFTGLATYTMTIFGTTHDETIPVIDGYYVKWSGE